MVSTKFVPESSGFKRYAVAASAREYLSAEREAELATKAAAGDLRAQHVLVEAHLRQVIKVASSYRNYGHTLDTLTSVGNVGLVMAAQKFDISKGFRFATYARWWIDAEIKEFVLRDASMVKIPNSKGTRSAFFKAPKLRRELEAQGMDEDTVLEIMAHRFSMEKDEMAAVLAARVTSASLSAPLSADDGDAGTFGDTIADEGPSPEEIVIESDEQDNNVRRLNAILSEMNERESDILRSRHLVEEPMTLEALAARYSVSKERVRQIEAKAMGRVRQALMAA